MYHPTTRVLTVLELLQSHQRLSGPELAERLEVNVRTARRYITMLQDMGIPIEAERGRYGAYRLRPSFKLPPLMFSEDEALAVTLGLLAARRLGLTLAAPAAEGALAKIERVLPPALRERLHAVQATLTFDLIRAEHAPDRELLMVFSEAAQQSRQVLMHYQAEGAELRERAFDPYGLVYRQGRWYAVGFCHLRQDLRIFRLDRVTKVWLGDALFVRPGDFDAAAYVVQSIARIPNTWEIELLLHMEFAEAQQRVPPVFGTLAAEEDGLVLYAYAESLRWFARELVALDLPFAVRRPPELRDELRALAERIMLATEVTGDRRHDDRVTR